MAVGNPVPSNKKNSSQDPPAASSQESKNKIGKSIHKSMEIIDEYYCKDESVPRMRYNEITGRIDFDSRSGTGLITNRKVLEISTWLEKEFGLAGGSTTIVSKAIELLAYKYQYNPLSDYIIKCGLLHKQSSIEIEMSEIRDALEGAFLTMFSAEDSPYMRQASFLFLISLVRRAISPGCQQDYIYILEGPQGCGKTRALKAMGGKFYKALNESLAFGMQKARESIEGGWVVEVEEFATFNKSTPDVIKSFISVDRDEYRKPYDREVSVIERSCVFFATTNEKEYLSDLTGNRRFIPIEINHDSENPIDVKFIQQTFPLLIGMAWEYIYNAGRDKYLEIHGREPEFPQYETDRILRLGINNFGHEYQLLEKLAVEIVRDRVKKEPTQDLVTHYLRNKNEVSVLELAINALGYLGYEAGQRISGRIGKEIKKMILTEGFHYVGRMKHDWPGKSDLKLPERERVYKRAKKIHTDQFP